MAAPADQPIDSRVAGIERADYPPEVLVAADLLCWPARNIPPRQRDNHSVQYSENREHGLVGLTSFHACPFC